MPSPTGGTHPVGSALFSVGGGGGSPVKNMDYGNPINFLRTSCRCMFQATSSGTLPPLGSVPGVDFGDIVKVTGDLSPTEVEVYSSQNGYQTLVRMDVAKLKPVFTISCHEFVQDNIPLIFSGTDNGAVVQPVAAAQVFTIPNPQPGSAWDIGVSDLSAVTVKAGVTSPGTTPLVLGVDYDLDPKTGLIRFIDSSTVVTGSIGVYVTYTAPTITFRGTTGLNRPNVLGWMTLWVTDSNSPAYRSKMTFQTILSSKKLPDFDVSKFTEIDMSAAVLGNLNIVYNNGVTL